MKYSEQEVEIIRETWRAILEEYKDGNQIPVYKTIKEELDSAGYARTERGVKYKLNQLKKTGQIPNVKPSEVYGLNDEGGEDDSSEDGFTEDQRHLISLLPSTKEELVQSLGFSGQVVDYLIHQLVDQDVGIQKDEQGVFYLEDQPKKRRLSTTAKGTVTRKMNEYRTEQEAAILRRLKSKPPLDVDISSTPEKEDLVIAIGDTHFGDVVEDDRGKEVYNSNIASAYVRFFQQQVLKLKNLQETYIDFENAHIFLTGDIVTNENIYEHQPHHLDALADDQLALSISVLLDLIESIADNFKKVQVTAIPGNHGEIRASAQSKSANFDLLLYRWLQDRLIDRGYHGKIGFSVGEASHYRNVLVRNHKYHLRHGHNSQIHVDATARSQADSRGWLQNHDCDVVVRGHHHTFRLESIMNSSICVTCPSPKPGGAFAEKIGRGDASDHRKIGVIWRASDQRPMIGNYVVDDINCDPEEVDYTTLEEVREKYSSTLNFDGQEE